MVKIYPYAFVCPFCSKDKLTFITEEKYEQLKDTNIRRQDIFPRSIFNPSYTELFISRVCYDCWLKTFGPDDDDESINQPFDVDADEDTTEIYNKIYEMYEKEQRS